MVALVLSFLTLGLICTAVWFFKLFQISGIAKKHLIIGILIKAFACYLFIYLFSYVYTQNKGTLGQDAGAVFHDAYILNSVFYSEPSEYFSFIFGTDTSDELVTKHLSKTSHWSKNGVSTMNESQNLVRIHAIIGLFAKGNIYIHFFCMLLISYFGLKQAILWLKERRPSLNLGFAFFTILLIPSILFWSIGILREPFVILAIGLILRGLFGLSFTRKKAIGGIFGILLLLVFKMYVAFYLLLFLLLYLYFKSVSKKNSRLVFVLVVLSAILFCTIPNKYRDSTIAVISRKQNDFNNMSRGGLHILTDSCYIYISGIHRNKLIIKNDSVLLLQTIDAETYDFNYIPQFKYIKLHPIGKYWKLDDNCEPAHSYFKTTPIRGSGWQLIKNIPSGITNALLRPFPWDEGRLLKYWSFIEILFYLAAMLITLKQLKTLNADEKNLWKAFIISSLLLLLLIGWTTPVSGAIVRYRIPFLFLLFPLLLLSIKFTQKQKTWIDKWFV